MVQRAGRTNGGLVLDSWHFFRSGSTLAQLQQVPGERIYAVQLSDGPAIPASDLAEESSTGRLLPGEGDFDLPELMATLRDIGGLGSVGPEVFSLRIWQLPAEEAGVLLGQTTTALTSAHSTPSLETPS